MNRPVAIDMISSAQSRRIHVNRSFIRRWLDAPRSPAIDGSVPRQSASVVETGDSPRAVIEVPVSGVAMSFRSEHLFNEPSEAAQPYSAARSKRPAKAFAFARMDTGAQIAAIKLAKGWGGVLSAKRLVSSGLFGSEISSPVLALKSSRYPNGRCRCRRRAGLNHEWPGLIAAPFERAKG